MVSSFIRFNRTYVFVFCIRHDITRFIRDNSRNKKRSKHLNIAILITETRFPVDLSSAEIRFRY